MLQVLYSIDIFSFILYLGTWLFPNQKLPAGSRNNQQIPVLSDFINHAPVVKIRQPSQNAVYAWNSLVPYSIEITDPEDGDSKFEEIASNEVMVKLKFVRDPIKAAEYLKQKKFSDTTGLSGMLISNCFNCHSVKTKLAGPAFQEIAIRYTASEINRHQLVNHIKNGSSGVWGKETMPSHPELTDSVAGQMVKWILNYANDPGLNYFTGLKGVLPLNKPLKSSSKGIYIVMAFYTDHGTADFGDKRITGSDHLTIKVK